MRFPTAAAEGHPHPLSHEEEPVTLGHEFSGTVTALGEGTVSVGAGGTVSGTVIGVGGVSASGSSVDASLVSANVSGATSGQSGLGTGGAANATANAASASDDSTKVAKKSEDTGEDDTTKKKTKGIALAQKVSRVTVLLPSKN